MDKQRNFDGDEDEIIVTVTLSYSVFLQSKVDVT